MKCATQSIGSTLNTILLFSGVLWAAVIFVADQLVHYLHFSYHRGTLLTNAHGSTLQTVLFDCSEGILWKQQKRCLVGILHCQELSLWTLKTFAWESFLWDGVLPSSQKCPPAAVGTSMDDGNDLMKCWPMHQTPEQKPVGPIGDFSFGFSQPLDAAVAATSVLEKARREHTVQIR